MPQMNPGRADVHINVMMTEFSVSYAQDPTGFVADRVFQNIPSDHRSNRYLVIKRDSMMRDLMQRRAPATESAGATYEIDTTPNFYCNEWGLHRDIIDDIRNDADAPIDEDTEATMFLTQQALLNREMQFIQNWFKAGIWTGGDYAGVAAGGGTGTGGAPGTNQFLQFNNDDSKPIETVRSWITLVAKKTGRRPNVLTVGRPVYDVFLDHPDIVGRLDRGQTTGPANTLKANLAELFEVDEVNVMDAIVNSAIEGATLSTDFVGGKGMLLSYRPPNPGRNTPAAGYTFTWRKARAYGPQGWAIYKLPYDARRKVDTLEVETYYQQAVIASDLGFFGATAVA